MYCLGASGQSLVKSGRTRWAQRMANIIRTFGLDKSSRDYRLVIRSLEKVQGPLRHQLHDVEDRAMQMASASQRKPGR
jgi:hypothetical protein